MRGVDFSSWQGIASTLLGVGIRLLLMQTVQQRREIGGGLLASENDEHR